VTLDRRRRGSEHDTDETTKGDPLCPAHMASDARSFGGLPPNLRLSTVAICNGRLTRIHDVRSLATNACKGSSPASQQGTRDFAAIGEVSEGQIVPVRRTVGTGGHQAFRDGLVRRYPARSRRSANGRYPPEARIPPSPGRHSRGADSRPFPAKPVDPFLALSRPSRLGHHMLDFHWQEARANGLAHSAVVRLPSRLDRAEAEARRVPARDSPSAAGHLQGSGSAAIGTCERYS
jgi:hypothetical protein